MARPDPEPSSEPIPRPEAEVAGSLRLLRVAASSLALAGGVGALELARSRFQRSQVFLPSRYPTGIWDPAAYGLAAHDVWFPSEDGTRLHGWWIEHARASGTVIYCHGNSGSIGDRIGVYSQLRRLRVNVLAFDYRGYGRSEGSPSEKGLFADVRAACDFVTGPLGQSLDRVLLFGHSLGGAVAIDGAVHRPVAGLVVQSSFTDLRAMARHAYPGLPIYLIARNEFRSIDKVPRLSMPALFIHGTEDSRIPHAMGEQLHAAAPEPKRWFPVPRAGHNDVHRHRPLRYFHCLARFRRQCLGG